MAERKRRSGLGGRGLDAIFGEGVEKVLDDIQNSALEVPGRREVEIDVNDIRPNPYQPRREFDPDALNELADSIRTHGIFTPLLVRRSISGYDLITGERRLRAAKIAGLDKVPAISVDFTDEQMMEISILENVQREDLNPIEEAMAYDSLVRKLGYTQEKLAERVGKSREYCANIMRLLKLPKDEDQIYDAANYVMKAKLSVREVENYVRELNGSEGKKKTRKDKVKDPLIRDLENRMQDKFGTKVSVGRKAITISYTDTEDLNRILELLGCIEE